MGLISEQEQVLLQQQLVARNELVLQLQEQLANLRERWEAGAREWQRFLRYQSDLGEWLVDAVTDEDGRIIKSQVDAGLVGDKCIPGTFSVTVRGKRYQISLISTDYEVQEN